MSNQLERELVKKAYPSPSWSTKVDKMPDSQVLAILFRLRRQGKL